MDKLKYALAALLLAGCVHTLIVSMQLSRKSQLYKYEQATIDDARFGIFNMDKWKNQFNAILMQEIADFQLNGDNRAMIKTQLEQLLSTLIDQVKDNVLTQSSGGIWDKLKGVLVVAVIDFDNLKQQIPEYADDILSELEKEENINAIKEKLQSRISGFVSEIGDGVDVSIQQQILNKYQHKTVADCSTYLQGEIDLLHKKQWLYSIIGIVLSLILWVIMLASEAQRFDNYILAVSCLLLLVGGLFLPMLDLKAGLDTLKLTLLGNEVKFDNQVLFFQSKSIIQVVQTLFVSKTANGIVVGVLVLLFSVVFPFSKMLASIGYINNHQLAENSIIKFLVFESGKWSMADVFVVALMMTYLGFSGIIQSQLGRITQTDAVQTISFNHTSFQPGFTWFIAFCLAGLFFSTALKKLKHE